MERQRNPVKVKVIPDHHKGKISKYIYSHFAENLGRGFYEGIWVGRNSEIPQADGIRLDVANALKELELACMRLPGGNFADNYHWQDGIGPEADRPVRYNANWGAVDSNAFGTHEYIRFCEMIGAEPYFCANVGSGTVEEARAWVEYCNVREDTALTRLRAANGHKEPFNVKFWGVGNEMWGCGGKMTPEYYSDVFKRYAFYMRITDPGIKLVLSGSHGMLEDWDEIVLQKTYKSDLVDLLGFHAYFGNMPDLTYSDDQYLSIVSQIRSMKKKLTRATGLCRAYSTYGRPIKVAFDEWGTWFKEGFADLTRLEQQSSMLNGVFTALAFHVFHEFNEELYMANGSETVNVLQALILTDREKMCLTPTYYIYKMFKVHKDGIAVETRTEAPSLRIGDSEQAPAVSVSASRAEDGTRLHVSLVNISLSDEQEVELSIKDFPEAFAAHAELLYADQVRHHNKPGEREQVRLQPLELRQDGNLLRFILPPHSVAVVSCQL